MSSLGDESSPKIVGTSSADEGVPEVPLSGTLAPSQGAGLSPAADVGDSAPTVRAHQEIVDSIWPILMREVETKMVGIEQELIKRHNIKMMNEMQEVVRQIKQAKTKNDEILRDYHKKQTDLTRSVLEIAEKYAAMRVELDEMKRQAVVNKQQLTHRCDQTTEQVAQLKHAVFTAWQKEKQEIQQKVSQSFRGDLALVLGQFDAKLREGFSETSKLRYEVKRLMAKMNGEDPDSVAFEMPSYVDTAAAAVSRLPSVEPSVPQQQQQQSAAAEDTSSAPPGMASPAAAPAGVNMASLTQNLAAFIARQQQTTGVSGGPPQVNVAMLQQFMQTLPRQQQLQLQMLLQQHRAQQQSPTTPAPAVAAPAPVAAAVAPQTTTPSYPPGLGLGQSNTAASSSQPSLGGSVASAAPAPAGGAPAATMIQSLAQQLQLQVNAAQQKASSSGPGSVNCPFFAMFGWCKFGDRCKYVHQPTGKEPLRNLPHSVIQTLQTQLASGMTAETTQTLMTALAGLAAARQQQGSTTSTIPPPPGLSATSATAAPAAAAAGGSTNAVQQAMIQAQIQAQQEAAQMGTAKAKSIHCRFFAIGRCAYGDRCAYSHSSSTDTSSSVAAAAAAAWGKTDLNQPTWGGAPGAGAKSATNGGGSDEGGLIMEGEDDTAYDQWNSMTFDDSSTPPGL